MTGPSERRIAVIVNPRAGRGRAAHAGRAAETVLRASGAQVRVHAADTAEGTRALAEQIVAAHPDVVVVVGGDGTLTGIVDVLADAAVPVVLVPAGTGDDLARALGIPRDDPARAASAALDGRRRAIDLGTVETGGGVRPFLTVAALGFDALVSERTNRLRYPSGPLRYYVAIAIELLRLRPTCFRVRIDDGPETAMPGTLLAVGSTAGYGGGMPICAGAVPDDGLLDMVHVAPLSRLRLIRLFPLLLRGTHLRRPEVTTRHATAVRVTAPDLVVYADGERVGAGECCIGIRPSALILLTPEERR